MNSLPHWNPGTPAVLIVAGPHAIAISTAIRRGDRRLVFALGRRRDALERLRAEPSAAIALLGEDAAFTAYGTARVVREELTAAAVTGLELQVDRIQDHLADGRTAMLGGATYRWLDSDAAAAEPGIWSELATL